MKAEIRWPKVLKIKKKRYFYKFSFWKKILTPFFQMGLHMIIYTWLCSWKTQIKKNPKYLSSTIFCDYFHFDINFAIPDCLRDDQLSSLSCLGKLTECHSVKFTPLWNLSFFVKFLDLTRSQSQISLAGWRLSNTCTLYRLEIDHISML